MFVAVALKGNNNSNTNSNNNMSNNKSSRSNSSNGNQKKRPKQSCGSRRCKVSKIVWARFTSSRFLHLPPAFAFCFLSFSLCLWNSCRH